MGNDIGGIIFDTCKAVTGHGTKRSETDSWTNSLQYMERVLSDPAIPSLHRIDNGKIKPSKNLPDQLPGPLLNMCMQNSVD